MTASRSAHFDEEERKVSAWLEPLAGESGPCGSDLEYDNDFLAISQAAAGKPESQFGAAEPPDWRAVSAMAEALLARSRDLRVAILWLRAGLHLQGFEGVQFYTRQKVVLSRWDAAYRRHQGW